MKRAALFDGPSQSDERKKAKKDTLAVGPSQRPSSEQLPLDRSHLVVHRELTKSQAGMTSLHEFVESINDQLMKTGLAVVSIEQMPRSLQHLRQRPKETVELLGKLLGSRYHFATYSYVSMLNEVQREDGRFRRYIDQPHLRTDRHDRPRPVFLRGAVAQQLCLAPDVRHSCSL